MKRLLFSVFTVLLTLDTAWADSFEDSIAAHGRGDYTKAVKWYRLAAAQGNAYAQSNLGFRYYNCQGIAQY